MLSYLPYKHCVTLSGQIPNLKGCRRGTGDNLSASEIKLNWREKLGTNNGGVNVTVRTICKDCQESETPNFKELLEPYTVKVVRTVLREGGRI
jgi:hypothetical protein